MTLKSKFKTKIQALTQGSEPAWVVASFGRSGSTLVYDALVSALATKRFGRGASLGQRLVRDVAWSLDKKPLHGGVVYKTHDLPTALPRKGSVKCLFLFGSAIEAALSFYSGKERFGAEWIAECFRILKIENSFEDLFECDALGFEQQVSQWCTCDIVDVLCLRYETLWEHKDQISMFCGMPIKLPAKRPRTKKCHPEEIFAQAKNIYGPLDKKLLNLPDCFIANHSYKTIVGV